MSNNPPNLTELSDRIRQLSENIRLSNAQSLRRHRCIRLLVYLSFGMIFIITIIPVILFIVGR